MKITTMITEILSAIGIALFASYLAHNFPNWANFWCWMGGALCMWVLLAIEKHNQKDKQ